MSGRRHQAAHADLFARYIATLANLVAAMLGHWAAGDDRSALFAALTLTLLLAQMRAPAIEDASGNGLCMPVQAAADVRVSRCRRTRPLPRHA